MTLLFWTSLVFMTLLALSLPLFALRKTKSTYRIIVIPLLVIVFPLIAFSLYWNLGASQDLQRYWSLKDEAKTVKLELSKIKNPAQVINRLKEYLKEHPNSPKGWYLLGKLYLGSRRYAEANSALKKAHDEQPSNARTSVAYAQANFFLNHRHCSPSLLKMLKRIINQQPHNVSALNLLAIHYYLQSEYKIAVQYWERLLPLFQAGSPDQKMLLYMIASAQKHIKRRE